MQGRGFDVYSRIINKLLKPAILVAILIPIASNCAHAQVDDLHKVPDRPRKRFYPLSIETKPSGQDCTISIGLSDGRELRPKALVFNLAAGSYTLNVQCAGFKKYSGSLLIPRDLPPRRTAFHVPLERLRTEVTIFTDPAEAEIYLGNLPMKRSGPDGLLVLRLDYGRYEMRVQKSGFLPRPKVVQLNLSSETHRENVTLELDKIGKDQALLNKALEENRIQDSIDLYERLRDRNSDRGMLRQKLAVLIEKLNQHSANMLERQGLNGMELDYLEVADMRRWCLLVRSFVAEEALEKNPAFELVQSLWEVEWIAHEILRDPSARSAAQHKDRVLVELGRLEVLQGANAILIYEVGCIYRRLGEFDAAKRAFNKARLANPAWAYPYYASGSIQMNEASRDPKDKRRGLLLAAGDFEQAIARDINFIKPYIMLAICYADARQSKNAIAVARKAEAISPESGQVKFALGYSYFSAGRSEYARARSFLEASLLANQDPLNTDQINTVNSKLKEIRGRGK
jgi:tetratricopeptide (TPR) repeat protein